MNKNAIICIPQKPPFRRGWGGFILLLFFNLPLIADTTIATFQSPDEKIEIRLSLDENGAPYYTIKKEADALVSKSQLGINTSLADFTTGMTLVDATTTPVDQNYTLPSGKKSTYKNKYNQLSTTLSKSGTELQILIRAYNDGIAYQYLLEGTGSLTIHSEASTCNITTPEQIYSQVYSKDYRTIIEESDWKRQSCLKHTALPFLAKTKNSYILITEAMVNGNYSASRLVANEATQGFTYTITGTVNTQLPFQSPWRTIMIGDLNTIVQSTMMENLNPPTQIADITWIKPGRAVSNYLGEDTSGYLTTANIRQYIDWAQEMGYEYFTLDRGWQNNSQVSLSEVLSHARSKNVGIFIWVNQHMLPNNEEDLRNTLRNWRNQGIKGIKADFWEDDSQEMMKKYDLLLTLTAEQKLMLNLHSCTKPTGLRTTWPHLLSSEAVLGNDYYAQRPNIITASHNINNAILRGSLGPTNYSTVDFADKNGRIHYATTWAHQLALSVIFESGIQHITDAPANIRYSIAKDFLKKLPAGWDNIRCIEAQIGNHITIARSKGEDWYLASIANEERNSQVSLSFLPADRTYNAYIYKDGSCPSEILFQYTENLTAADNLNLTVANNGGYAVILSPTATYEKPVHTKYEAESPDNNIPFGVAVKTDTDSLCSGNQYVAFIGKGRPLTFNKIKVSQSGTYALTFYYMANTTRYAYVKINDKIETFREYTFHGTGKDTGSGLAHKTILVELEAFADNIMEFGNYTEYAPGLDRIVISHSENNGTNIPDIEQSGEYGEIYARDKHIIITQENPVQNTQYHIYNIMGQTIKTGTFTGATISVPIPDTGVYLVKVNANNQERTQKVMIK